MGGLLLIIAWLAVLGILSLAVRRRSWAAPLRLDWLALGLLGLLTAGFFWRVISGQNWMPADGGDLVSYLFPSYRYAAAALREGAFPLWNPHQYGGMPHAGDIQAGFLYPPNLLLFLLRPDFPYAALQALSMGHLWFAGAGMYLLLARGLVDVVAGADARTRKVSLTREGRAAIAAAEPYWARAQAAVSRRVGRDKVDALIATLGEIESLHPAPPA